MARPRPPAGGDGRSPGDGGDDGGGHGGDGPPRRDDSGGGRPDGILGGQETARTFARAGRAPGADGASAEDSRPDGPAAEDGHADDRGETGTNATGHSSPDGAADRPDPERTADDKADPENAADDGTGPEHAADDQAGPEDGVSPDPAGGAVTYGKNEVSHLRSHSQDIREAARAEGVDIPKGPSKPETRQAMRGYIEDVVESPDVAGVGNYKTVEGAIWSKRGDLIVIRKPDGEFITTLRESGGRAATNAPWNNGGDTGAGT